MKVYFSIVLFVIINFYSFGQTSIGVKSGLNLSKAVYLNEYNEELIKPIRTLKPGFVAGFFIQQELNKIISVKIEVLYSQKGLKTVQEPIAKYISSMNYVEVPLIGSYSLTKNKHSNFDIYIGGYGAYWTDGKFKRIDLISSETTKTNVNFNDKQFIYKRINAGILFGFTYKKNKSSYFLRYTHSMIGSSQENADALSNRVITLGINYFIFN